MSSFNERLRAERKRLGLNQEKFASLGGVTKDTQLNYENGSRKPDSEYLELIARAGVDVTYLLTEVKAENNLTDDESELIEGYRGLDVRGKAGVLGMIDGLSGNPAASKNQSIIHGKVGQQIVGDINGPNTINMPGKKSKK
ncbi:helix-turn-helix domain-containing protein [Undibacterium umbellatum]|uniref:Helix-turn-helix transcriptional regulator n=1 Tax=Undibacterium umbellatum TaxID=2762300 RepID=A0ABR6ZIQ9_9BURK|nr:helix-turn-helix transcriptional regulator [Undibacterium umbellatum]MBC3911580.1 helix-turn-helix transcriptional regulator [Undibacterium umbellatum]